MSIALSAPVPTASKPTTVKSVLARLLATENISVEHADVQTAAFDLRTRTLILPRWKDMSNALYDMLVGHEVSHALHTPQDGWRTDSEALAAKYGVSAAVTRQYLNIAEDARIERMIKDKFPGLRSDFFKGYGELHSQNFFNVSESEMPSLSLADRVNLHSKLGLHVDAVIPFNAEEATVRDFVMGAKTWADTVAGAERMLALDLQNWKQEQNEQQQDADGDPQGTVDGDPESDGEDGEGESEAKSDSSDSQDGQNSGQDKDGTDGGDDARDAQNGQSKSGQEQSEGESSNGNSGITRDIGMPSPVTNSALEQSLKSLNETASKCPNIVRARMSKPTTDVVVPFATVLKDVESICAKQRVNTSAFRNTDYSRASSTMATAFDRRKSADVWRRTTVAKTGAIDTLRMNQYKWNEDIFRRTTRIADGKNHGIVILLDWSSSMHGIMQSTLGQLIILTDFCRLAGVPFEVFAFSDQPYYTLPAGVDPYSEEGYTARSAAAEQFISKDHNTASPGHVRLLNFLSSRMTAPQYERMKSALYNGWGVFGTDYRYRMGSTPTTAALHHASAVVEEFIRRNRIQIAHTIVLTDGEPTDEYNVYRGGKTDWYSRNHNILEDAVTGASYDLRDSYYHDANGKHQRMSRGSVQWKAEPANRSVAIAIDALRRRTGSKVHWIGLTDRVSRTVPCMGGFEADADANWSRDGYARGTAASWDTAVVAAACRFGDSRNASWIEKAMDKMDEKIESAKTTRTLFNAVVEKQAMTNSLRSLATIIGEFLAQ